MLIKHRSYLDHFSMIYDLFDHIHIYDIFDIIFDSSRLF